MRLNSLHIENFRGINGTYALEVDGESRVIVGPNGSGKSSILGAIDFLLSGTVTHLSGEGMGGAYSEDVISHVNADNECLVRSVFTDSETGQAVDVERKGTRAELTPEVGDLPVDLRQLFNTAEQGQHILTRDDILDLIITRPGKRREVLQTMLDLPEIDDQRLALKRTRQDLKDKLENANASADDTLTRVQEMADSEADRAEAVRTDVLDKINDLRGEYGGAPVESFDPEQVREGLESPATMVAVDALQREQPVKALDDLSGWTERLENEIVPLFEEMADLLRGVKGLTDVQGDAKRLELLKLGEDIVSEDADVCPLCNQSWDDPNPLHEDIRTRRLELRDLQRHRDRINSQRKHIKSELGEGAKLLDYLSRELDAERYDEAEKLAEFHQLLNTSIEAISEVDVTASLEDLEFLPIVERLTTQTVELKIRPLQRTIENLNQIQEGFTVITEREEKYERIKSLAVEWNEYQNAVQRAAEIQRLHDEVETAEQDFIEARKTVIGQIYDEIADTVQEYYSRIHPDEAGGDTTIEVTDTGAELQQQFYEAGQYPPQLVQSEGHLDTLGLSMFLALSEYLQQDGEGLLLLDDIVMSIDNGHRREIAQLLAEEVADQYQLFIATHDELWAEQLRSHGALHGGSSVKLREWSPDSGIVESEDRVSVEEQWETAVEAMESDEMEKAAHEMRYAVEKMLQQTCMALGAKVEYKPKQDYTVSDFKDGVNGRLGMLTGKAKDELHGYEHHPDSEEREQMYEQVDALKSEYGEVLDDVGQTLQKVNRRVHWSPGKWLTLGPAEFREVFEVHRRAYDLLYCDDCGSSIQYQKFGAKGEENVQELRCNCCSHYYIRW